VVGALDRASAYFDRHIVAFTVTFSTLATVALALMVAFDDDREAVAVVAIATPAFVAFLAFVATEDATTRLRHREWRASARRLIAQRDAMVVEHERALRDAIGGKSVGEMSAYEMSAELARMATREHELRHALRYAVTK
jgi:hypothetical protein